MTRKLRYAWIRFRRNLRKTIVSKVRVDGYNVTKVR